MTKDEINAKIAQAEAELRNVKRDISRHTDPGAVPLATVQNLMKRWDELEREIAGLNAQLDDL